jgi:hypothetical protein
MHFDLLLPTVLLIYIKFSKPIIGPICYFSRYSKVKFPHSGMVELSRIYRSEHRNTRECILQEPVSV